MTEQQCLPSPDNGTPVVLLVDDHPINLQLLTEHLAQENYRVLVAESGESALERIRYVQPDIILLDVLMPGMNGFDTCRQLKANPATHAVPVLFLSALDDEVDKVQGFEAGGVDYITKPLQVIEVLARIRTHLTLRQLQRRLEEQNEALEERVQVRTAQLQAEIEQRKQQEATKQKLLDVLVMQSDQLQELTTFLIAKNQEHRQGLAAIVTTHIQQRLQQILQQVAIVDAVGATITNATERYQFMVQLQQLRTAITQLKHDLDHTTAELQQSSTDVQSALENPLLKLSARELEVLQLIVDGKSNAQVAEMLHISEVTVRGYRSRLLQKLELDDTHALVKFAVQHNLTSL